MLCNRIQENISEQFKDMLAWGGKDIESSTFWTTKIKTALESANKDDNVELRYTNKINGNSVNWEFVYDFIYLRTGKKDIGDGYFEGNNIIRRVLAIVESEFNPNSKEILYDFAKLLLGKADLKVMIFYHSSNEASNQVISEIRRMISTFTQSTVSEQYLVCWFDHNIHGFSFLLFDGGGGLLQENGCPTTGLT